MKYWRFDLKLAHTWAIASDVVTGGKDLSPVAIVELTAADGAMGLGEAAPSRRYKEDVPGVLEFLAKVDAGRLSFGDIPGSMKYVEGVAPGQYSAKSAINVALLDGAARIAKKPLYDFLGLGFRENHHVTSFTIGIAKPEVMREKTIEAEQYPILKLKMGAPADRENLKAVRDAAPKKTIRVDANEGWKTKEQALEMIEWLAKDGHIEYVEQPMSSSTPMKEMAWLKSRSPLPLFADESFHTAADAAPCAEGFHGVNMKLCKTAGVSNGYDALQAARKQGLKTMIGCMIESSILISAGAHLAELADYLDLDGSVLITNDPFRGVTAKNGVMSFASATEKFGLRVRRGT